MGSFISFSYKQCGFYLKCITHILNLRLFCFPWISMIFRLIVCFLQVGTIIRQGALLLVLRMAAGGHYYFARHYYRFCENLQGGTIIQQALLFGKLEYLNKRNCEICGFQRAITQSQCNISMMMMMMICNKRFWVINSWKQMMLYKIWLNLPVGSLSHTGCCQLMVCVE